MSLKQIIVLIFFVFLASIIEAQSYNSREQVYSRLYIRIYAAYGFLTPGSYKGQPTEQKNAEYGRDGVFFKDISYYKLGNRGVGGGLRAGAGIGVILNEFFNIGIDGEYIIGNTIKLSEHRSDTKLTIMNTTAMKYQVLSIIPNITFKAVLAPPYNNYIYSRLGIIVGLPLNFKKDYVYTSMFYDPDAQPGKEERKESSMKYNADYELKIGIGTQATIGGQVKIHKRIRGFFEISGYLLSFDKKTYEELYKAKKETIKYKNEDPKSLESFSRNLLIYSKNGTNEPNNWNVTGGFPNHLFTYTVPSESIIMNAITINTGITLRF